MKDKPVDSFSGFDGSCPPWNDAKLHNYHFTVYALGGMIGKTGSDNAALERFIQERAIAKGEIVGTYSNFVPAK